WYSDGPLPDIALSNGLLLHNNGDGTFQSPGGSSGYVGTAIAAGPLNSVGDAVAMAMAYANGFVIRIDLPAGGNGFSGLLLNTGNNPLGLAFADFNLDGLLDLVSANSGDNTVTLFLQTAPGSFTPMGASMAPALTWGVGQLPRVVQAG